jgi:hypothetical protein
MTSDQAATLRTHSPCQQELGDARIAEYQTLRAESDRISQLLSNAIWVGITGFGLTVVAAASFANARMALPHIMQAIALLLAVQSTAISTMYASELWKYARVGWYIRDRIEKYFRSETDPPVVAMDWETWIRKHRAKLLYQAALGFLQAPILGCLLMLIMDLFHWPGPGTFVGQYAGYLVTDWTMAAALLSLIALDLVLMTVLYVRILRAQNGRF